MGAKLRSLEAIRLLAQRLAPEGGLAVDLFTGSSVVAQTLSETGFTVSAHDALAFAAMTAEATLGVGRREKDNLLAVGQSLWNRAQEASCWDWLAPWLDAEDQSISQADGMALLRLGASFPQVWRMEGAKGDFLKLLERVASQAGKRASAETPVAVSHYAGTYFGIRQAYRIDALRHAIAAAPLTPWQNSAALTALISAMSDAAYTAGKHFAQPHRIVAEKDLYFHQTRALSDRSIDIGARFLTCLKRIQEIPFKQDNHHRAEQIAFETLLERAPAEASLIYADPPYTAQQYGRFYHVPEIITNNLIPQLQVFRNQVTTGIYPENRFMSRFCSRRQVAEAFNDMMVFATRSKAKLIISYAGSVSGQTGNDRLIDLGQIIALLKANRFRKVEVTTLDHNYRQLNQKTAAVSERSDVEFLISGTPAC